MSLYTVQRRASMLIAAASLLFLAMLFFDWQKVAVDVAGVVDVESATSGWSGWGVVAGVLAIALLVLGIEQTRLAAETPRRALVTAAFALGLLGATALAVFTGDASVQAAPVDIQVDTTLWPAWVGFALAIVIVAAALLFLDVSAVERGPRPAPGHEAT